MAYLSMIIFPMNLKVWATVMLCRNFFCTNFLPRKSLYIKTYLEVWQSFLYQLEKKHIVAGSQESSHSFISYTLRSDLVVCPPLCGSMKHGRMDVDRNGISLSWDCFLVSIAINQWCDKILCNTVLSIQNKNQLCWQWSISRSISRSKENIINTLLKYLAYFAWCQHRSTP